MLTINMEFRKGILFVRLEGNLDKTTVEKLNEVTNLVEENGIKKVVFNIAALDTIDMDGINALLANYQLCKKNEARSLVCNINNNTVKKRIENSRLLKYMYEASDELSATLMMDLEGLWN